MLTNLTGPLDIQLLAQRRLQLGRRRLPLAHTARASQQSLPLLLVRRHIHRAHPIALVVCRYRANLPLHSARPVAQDWLNIRYRRSRLFAPFVLLHIDRDRRRRATMALSASQV